LRRKEVGMQIHDRGIGNGSIDPDRQIAQKGTSGIRAS
jgi:hypothetical protein